MGEKLFIIWKLVIIMLFNGSSVSEYFVFDGPAIILLDEAADKELIWGSVGSTIIVHLLTLLEFLSIDSL